MKHFFAKCALSLLMLPAFCSNAGSLNLNGIAGGGNYNIAVSSYVERRFNTVYKQQYDFSCGSAALASLLTFHYDDEVTEKSAFVDMFENGDQDKIKQLGFSLLDMKNYLQRRGYRSDGFKISLDQLLLANSPAITIIDADGYLHFVIIKGLNSQQVLVGDPATGVSLIPRHQFEKMWGDRILFLIHTGEGVEPKNFQSEEEWESRKAPLAEVVDRSRLNEFNLLQPGSFDF